MYKILSASPKPPQVSLVKSTKARASSHWPLHLTSKMSVRASWEVTGILARYSESMTEGE